MTEDGYAKALKAFKTGQPVGKLSAEKLVELREKTVEEFEQV
jgi:hypothetical protein